MSLSCALLTDSVATVGNTQPNAVLAIHARHSKRIGDLDNIARQSIEAMLTANERNYKQQVLARVRYELEQMQNAMNRHDYGDAEAHRIRLEVYQSVLDVFKR